MQTHTTESICWQRGYASKVDRVLDSTGESAFCLIKTYSMLMCTQAAGILIAWPVLLGATALATYEIVTHQEAISRALGFAFASTLTLSALNIVASNLVYMVVAAANWHPRLRTNVRCTRQIIRYIVAHLMNVR